MSNSRIQLQNNGPQFAMVFGATLMSPAFMDTPDAAKRVFLALCLHARRETRDWSMGVAQLVKETLLSERSVRRAIRELVSRGLLTVTHQYTATGRQLRSSYTVHDDGPTPPPLCEHCDSPYHGSDEHRAERHQPMLGRARPARLEREAPLAGEEHASVGGGASTVPPGGASRGTPIHTQTEPKQRAPLTPQLQDESLPLREPEFKPELEPEPKLEPEVAPSSPVALQEAPTAQRSAVGSPEPHALERPEEPKPRPLPKKASKRKRKKARSLLEKKRSWFVRWNEAQVRLCQTAVGNAHISEPHGGWWERAANAEFELIGIMQTMMLQQAKPQLDHLTGQSVVHYRGSCRRRSIGASLKEAYRRYEEQRSSNE